VYYIEVRYQNEAERKRLEYLLAKWRKKVNRPSGYAFKVDDSVYKDLINEVENKFPLDDVSVFHIEPVKVEAPHYLQTIVYNMSKPLVEVRPFVEYLLSKRRAVLNRKAGNMEIYGVYTRKGISEIRVGFSDEQKLRVTIEFEGAKEAVLQLTDEFNHELQVYGGESIN
jgi:hypothetical protein